jgi:hypothetical protein
MHVYLLTASRVHSFLGFDLLFNTIEIAGDDIDDIIIDTTE